MAQTKGIIRIENPEYRRRRFVRSMILQSILQALTFAGAILTYHYLGMPPAVDDAYARGYGQAYRTYCTGTCLNK